jgi:hypothetical protein
MPDKGSATPVPAIPHDEYLKEAFKPYIAAVGSAMHRWNEMQEAFGQLFATVTCIGRSVALAVWYSTDSDRAQRNMLRAALSATPDDKWTGRLSAAKKSLIWALDRADEVADRRNDAAHAPCSLALLNGDLIAIAAYFHGNPRALKLKDHDVVAEFEWCGATAKILQEFVAKGDSALRFPANGWPFPDTPQLPNRPHKRILRDQRPQRRAK